MHKAAALAKEVRILNENAFADLCISSLNSASKRRRGIKWLTKPWKQGRFTLGELTDTTKGEVLYSVIATNLKIQLWKSSRHDWKQSALPQEMKTQFISFTECCNSRARICTEHNPPNQHGLTTKLIGAACCNPPAVWSSWLYASPSHCLPLHSPHHASVPSHGLPGRAGEPGTLPSIWHSCPAWPPLPPLSASPLWPFQLARCPCPRGNQV